MIFVIIHTAVLLGYWLAITLSIKYKSVSEYTQITDTTDAVVAFIMSFVPIVNILLALACLADSQVRFHK